MTPNFKLIYLFLSISLISHYSEAQSTDINSQIKEEFVNPPIYAWPKVYWWWLNGNIGCN